MSDGDISDIARQHGREKTAEGFRRVVEKMNSSGHANQEKDPPEGRPTVVEDIFFGAGNTPDPKSEPTKDAHSKKRPGVTIEDFNRAYASIINELGVPFHATRTSYVLNGPFFARLWATRRLAIYDQASETFYHYIESRGLFESLRENEIRRLIAEDLFAVAKVFGLSDIGSKITSNFQRGIIDLIKSDSLACHEDFFKFDHLAAPVIHAANGMICIGTDKVELCPFHPRYKSRNQIPIAYMPGSPCTRFLSEFLEKVLSPDDIEMLQRYCGLILIGGNRSQKLLFLLGKFQISTALVRLRLTD